MSYGPSVLGLVLTIFISCEPLQSEKTSYEQIRELVNLNLDAIKKYSGENVENPTADRRNSSEQSKGRKTKRQDEFSIKRREYAGKAKEMFFHAYNNYMTHAFPADELMPLSCKGRVRGLTKSRGEVDDVLGRYMLTVVDSLDTLVVLKEYDEFENAVRLVIRGISFDTDITVNLFEANIRILGGLLGGHAGCLYLQNLGRMDWYSNELLHLAVDLADRFLPAYDSPTGIPYSRINLRHGVLSPKDNEKINETCTACAGTLYLEMAALSRYTGNSSYEGYARVALDALFSNRIKVSDLPGSTINVDTGTWVRKDTGVGAGIDSYFEYLLKGYLISGDGELWDMFSTSYQATRKWIKSDKFLLTVHGSAPLHRARDYQDSLQAFWPGLQVLAGDLKEADEVYKQFIAVSRGNKDTLPESFSMTGKALWPGHIIRPELIESSYFLYKATQNPRYAEEGMRILDAINKRCRVDCGFAALKNTNTGELEDRLDSFVLAETFKYLYLMFADEEDVGIPIEGYVFTTEAHLIPLHIQLYSDEKVAPTDAVCYNEGVYTWTWLEEWFIEHYLTTQDFCDQLDQPIDFRPRSLTSALKPESFDVNNPEHVTTLLSMGITINVVDKEKVQLVHNSDRAYNAKLGVEGMIFMREVTDFAQKQQQQQDEVQLLHNIKEVFAQSLLNQEYNVFDAGKAMFGPELTNGVRVSGTAAVVDPIDGCGLVLNSVQGKVAFMERGGCMFVEKVRNAERAGAIAAVVLDNQEEGASAGVVAMSGDGTNDVYIPSVFLNTADGIKLLEMLQRDPAMLIVELREPSIRATEPKCGS